MFEHANMKHANMKHANMAQSRIGTRVIGADASEATHGAAEEQQARQRPGIVVRPPEDYFCMYARVRAHMLGEFA